MPFERAQCYKRNMLKAALALLTIIAVGCSSGPPPKPPTPGSASTTASNATATPTGSATVVAPPPEIPRDQFVDRLATAICDATKPCCAPTGARFDATFCRAQIAEMWNEELDELKAYDPQKAASCVANIPTGAADCEANIYFVKSVRTCAETFQPSDAKDLGQPCVDEAECAFSGEGAVFCLKKNYDPGEVGKCAVEVPGKLGAACKDALQLSDCSSDPNLRCGNSGKCERRAKAGEPCARHTDCTGTGLCSRGTCTIRTGKACSDSRQCGKKERCGDGRCGPSGKIGDACAGLLDCAEGMCAANTKKCATWSGVFLCSQP